MKLHIPGLPQIVQYAFDKLLNKGIGWDNLADEVWNRFRDQFVGVLFTHTLYFANMPGFILATGTTLIRADYPLLWDFAANQSNNIVTDEVWSAEKRYGSYSYGDGETTFRIPDLRGDFIRGYDPGRGIDPGRVLGSWQGDAIRNLTGTLAHGTNSLFWDGISTVSGVFAKGGEVGASANTGVTGSSAKSITLDASRMVPTANENRPRNIAYPFLIYTGEVW